jgi:hypothetical protein
MDIVNDVTYKHVNFQCIILFIVGFTKIIKSGDLNIYTSTRLSFLYGQKYKVLPPTHITLLKYGCIYY